MKSKLPLKTGVVTDEEVLSSLPEARVKPAARCVICEGEATPGAEQLCWVCRRLKISAWREVDQQAPAVE